LDARLVGGDQPPVGFDDLALGFNQLYLASIKEKLRIDLIENQAKPTGLFPSL
jgi:hypothetical protein